MKPPVIIAITVAMLGYTAATLTRPGQLTNIPGGVLESHALVYPVQAFIEVRYQMGALDKFTELLKIQDMSLGNIAVNIRRDNTLRESHKVTLQKAIKRLSDQISDMVESIPGNQGQKSREKRGLFNFIGILSHSLFGTIDEATFQGKLREYNNRLTAVTHSYTSSAKAINILEKNVQQLHESYLHLANNTASASALSATERFTELAFILGQYSDDFITLAHSTKSFARSLLNAAHGTVDSSLISPHDLATIFRKLKLESSSKPLFHAHHPYLYNSLTAFITSRGHTFLTSLGLSIIIPIYPPFKLTTYRIHPFPQQINNTILTITTPSLLLVSNTALAVDNVQPSILESCIHLEQHTYACLTPTWTYSHLVDSCQHALYARATCMSQASGNDSLSDCATLAEKLISNRCAFKEIMTKSRPFVLALSESTFLFYFQPTPVTITCQKHLTMKLITGPFVLPHKCQLQSLNLFIPTYRHYVTSFMTDIQFKEPQKLIQSNISSHVSQMNITYVPMEEVQETNFLYSTPFIVNYMYPVAVSATLIILAVLVAYFYVQRVLNHFDNQYNCQPTGGICTPT